MLLINNMELKKKEEKKTKVNRNFTVLVEQNISPEERSSRSSNTSRYIFTNKRLHRVVIDANLLALIKIRFMKCNRGKNTDDA